MDTSPKKHISGQKNTWEYVQHHQCKLKLNYNEIYYTLLKNDKIAKTGHSSACKHVQQIGLP